MYEGQSLWSLLKLWLEAWKSASQTTFTPKKYCLSLNFRQKVLFHELHVWFGFRILNWWSWICCRKLVGKDFQSNQSKNNHFFNKRKRSNLPAFLTVQHRFTCVLPLVALFLQVSPSVSGGSGRQSSQAQLSPFCHQGPTSQRVSTAVQGNTCSSAS